MVSRSLGAALLWLGSAKWQIGIPRSDVQSPLPRATHCLGDGDRRLCLLLLRRASHRGALLAVFHMRMHALSSIWVCLYFCGVCHAGGTCVTAAFVDVAFVGWVESGMDSMRKKFELFTFSGGTTRRRSWVP